MRTLGEGGATKKESGIFHDHLTFDVDSLSVDFGLGRIDTKRLDETETADLEVEPASFRLEGTDFSCTKVSYKGVKEGEKVPVVLWFSKDVKGLGLLAVDIAGTREVQLVGYGSASTSWGTRPKIAAK